MSDDGARCPAAASAAPGQVCAAGPSRPIRASPKGEWVESKQRSHSRRSTNVPRFPTFLSTSILCSRPVRHVHSTGFTSKLVHFYAPCHVGRHVQTCLFVPARFFTLSARMPVSPLLSESAFSVVLVRPDGRPMRPSRRGPSHRHVVPACQCLRRGVTACPGRAPYNHFVPVVWSGRGPACQQLASAAESSVSIS